MEKRGIFLENFSTYDFVSALRASLCSLKSCINNKEVFLRRWLCWYRVSMQNGSRFFWKKTGAKSIWSRQRLIWPIWLPEKISWAQPKMEGLGLWLQAQTLSCG